jgi:ACS family tartrate transporter-like MFS transporter
MDQVESAISKAKRRIIPILLIAYFAAFLDRVNVGFAALQMNQDLRLTATAFGASAGAFFITYVAFEIPSNLLLARFGARIWIARIMVTWGLLSAATAFAWNRNSLIVLRMLLGAAEAGFYPGMLFYLTQWFPRSHRARINSWVQIAAPISTVIGAPVSVVIMTTMRSWMGLRGWQWLFLIEGVPAVIVGLVIFFVLPNRPRDARWLTDSEREALDQRLAADQAQQEGVKRFTVREALSDRRVLLMCLMCVGNVIGVTATALWMPQIVRTFARSTLATGLLTAIPSLVAVFALLLCGWHADRTGERVWHVAGPYLVAAFGFVIAAFAGTPALILLGLVLGAAGIASAIPSLWALPAMLLTGTASAAGLALINSVGSIGGFVGPYIIGWARDRTGSFSGALLFMAGTMVVTALVVLVIGALMRSSLSPAPLQGKEKVAL